jgi:hypothetical protein
MKRLIEEIETEGLDKLIGEVVTLLCMNYFYTGKLIGVNANDVLLENAYIIYETGEWKDVAWKDAQYVCKELYVRVAAIEAYGKMK